MNAVLTGIDFDRLREECVELLREYLTFDTTNPPGDVSAAAAFVQDVLRNGGIESQRLEASPDKANVVATIGGDGGAPLILSHHMDVVGAPPEGWTTDPFSGELRDGYVYGRGALDMKGYGAMTIVCAIALKRLDVPMRRQLRLVITADEEVGGIMGAKWLAANHPQAIRGDFMLTEGSFARRTSRGTWYLVEVAQKGVSTVRLVTRGAPGHASAPTQDNAVVRMARALARLGDYTSPVADASIARGFLSAFPASVLRVERPVDEMTDEELEAALQKVSASRRRSTMLRNTLTPTMVNAGVGQNVIPAVCDAYVDCRSMPGVTTAEVLAEVAAAIDDPLVELELVKSSEGSSSERDTELFAALSDAIRAERPEALVIPFLTSGGTDAKHIRPLGVQCYGLIPFELDEDNAGGIHGIDERVSVANLELGLRILMRTILRTCVS